MSSIIGANSEQINKDTKIEQKENNQEIEYKANGNFSKKKVGEHIENRPLYDRNLYFAQYKGLSDIYKIAESQKDNENIKDFKEKNKEAIIRLLLDDLGSKNTSMTKEERSGAIQKVQDFFEKNGASLKEKFGITLVKNDQNNSEIKIGDQTFERVKCMGDGNCCYRAIAQAMYSNEGDYEKVRKAIYEKEMEMAENKKIRLPESLRYILEGVYGINPEDDESCREALKQHAENITKKEGEWGELVDVCFVPQLAILNNKRVFAFREFSSKKDENILYRCYAGDDKCNGLSEDIKPQKGDVVLLNINNTHWQMLKLKK